jgi:hypothetical protein
MERCLDKDVPEAARIRLRSRMPPATPYTFTHGDLTDQHHGQRWISYRHY